MADITSVQLKEDIAEILQGADITTVTSKKIRKQLEEKYSCDLIERKSEIDKICMEEIVRITSKKEEKSKSNGKDESGSDASDASDDDTPPSKKSKSSKMHDASDEDEVDDEDLARRLQEEEEENGTRRTRHGAKPPKTKQKRKKPKSSEDESDDEDSGKKKKRKSTGRTNKYTEPCYLSPQLSAIMNETRLKRSDVVKKMWAIVKERNLYDPKNKQFMICDEQMQTVFGCKRVRIFGMMKTLKNHIFSPDEYEANRS